MKFAVEFVDTVAFTIIIETKGGLVKFAADILESFRGYSQKTRFKIDDLTAFIGKNDAAKSPILEALEIFFDDGKPERGDVCVHGIGTTFRIDCAFRSLPAEIVRRNV